MNFLWFCISSKINLFVAKQNELIKLKISAFFCLFDCFFVRYLNFLSDLYSDREFLQINDIKIKFIFGNLKYTIVNLYEAYSRL